QRVTAHRFDGEWEPCKPESRTARAASGWSFPTGRPSSPPATRRGGPPPARPREVMIPAILDELDEIVDLDDVVVLVATGTHRANTDAELRALFGDAVVDAVRIRNHDSRAGDTHRWMGTF